MVTIRPGQIRDQRVGLDPKTLIQNPALRLLPRPTQSHTGSSHRTPLPPTGCAFQIIPERLWLYKHPEAWTSELTRTATAVLGSPRASRALVHSRSLPMALPAGHLYRPR
jgi:hypothetical protein